MASLRLALKLSREASEPAPEPAAPPPPRARAKKAKKKRGKKAPAADAAAAAAARIATRAPQRPAGAGDLGGGALSGLPWELLCGVAAFLEIDAGNARRGSPRRASWRLQKTSDL